MNVHKNKYSCEMGDVQYIVYKMKTKIVHVSMYVHIVWKMMNK